MCRNAVVQVGTKSRLSAFCTILIATASVMTSLFAQTIILPVPEKEKICTHFILFLSTVRSLICAEDRCN